MSDSLVAWRRLPVEYDSATRRVAVTGPHGHRLLDKPPEVHVFSGRPWQHIPGWRCVPGGGWDQEPGSERGFVDGYHLTDVADDDWYKTDRINEVSFGFPTWEGDSYEGYLWYRTTVAFPTNGDEPLSIVLGSPVERRRLQWRVFVDGSELTARPMVTGQVEAAVPENLRSDGDPQHVVAVQLRVLPERATPDRTREREGWRRIDLLCFQMVCSGSPWRPLPFDDFDTDGDGVAVLSDPSHGARIRVTYEAGDHLVRKRVVITNTGSEALLMASARLAAFDPAGERVEYHTEGAWATFGSSFQAVAHPSGATIEDDDGPASMVWPGIEVPPGTAHTFPDVLVAVGPHHTGVANVREYLAAVSSRPRDDVAIYDPYGWYQISHKSEPKVELTSGMMDDISALLHRLGDDGVTFDWLSLDCGWNDPDDLGKFHPENFPNGPAKVRSTVDEHRLQLMLWVSPSDGPRAFRHELGLDNPSLEGCNSGTGLYPWRLCPAAEPWATRFRDALVHHVVENQVRGFKVDGTSLWCGRNDHGHLPGIWSLYATTHALEGALAAAKEAGATFFMLYWGLRSPWWLRVGSTLYERSYLVEAAAPSGQRSWSFRLGVASSQDIGHQNSWDSIPSWQQDSLGVWVSNTAWASWQGHLDWDDAFILDLGRGSQLTQLWGDLRLLQTEAEAQRLKDAWALRERRARELSGRGSPLMSPAWVDGRYGYAWTTSDSALLVLVAPASAEEFVIPFEDFWASEQAPRSVAIDYVSRHGSLTATVETAQLRIDQSGGGVAAVWVSSSPGSSRAGSPPPRNRVDRWDRLESNSVELDTAIADVQELLPRYCRGRGPQIEYWGANAVESSLTGQEMLLRLPPQDRLLGRQHERWAGSVTFNAPGRAAVVVSFRRDGASWHNDRLHDLVDLSIKCDGVPADASILPNRPHEQAGSWSWAIATFAVESGRHEVEAAVTTTAPVTVQRDVLLWTGTT